MHFSITELEKAWQIWLAVALITIEVMLVSNRWWPGQTSPSNYQHHGTVTQYLKISIYFIWIFQIERRRRYYLSKYKIRYRYVKLASQSVKPLTISNVFSGFLKQLRHYIMFLCFWHLLFFVLPETPVDCWTNRI